MDAQGKIASLKKNKQRKLAMLSEHDEDADVLSATSSGVILEDAATPQATNYQEMHMETNIYADLTTPPIEPSEYQQYGWDTVMVFQRSEGGEEKHQDRYSCEVFYNLIIAYNSDAHTLID